MNQALHCGADLFNSRSTCGPQSATSANAWQRNNVAQVDNEFLDGFQLAAFNGLRETTNRVNGLVADSTRSGSPCSIAVVGFALSCLPIGIARGWITRGEAVSQALAAMRFFFCKLPG